MALISCLNAAFSYDGIRAVSDLDFRVDEGNYMCIIGENGSGKSTLIKGLLHLKSPDSGSLHFNDSLHLSDIGYLPQQTAVQKNFPASVFEVVLSGRLGAKKQLPFYTKEDKEAAAALVKKLEIENLKNHCYRELSGGQQQRVLLARAIIAAKKVLLLDEPASGLDPVIREEIYQLIASLNKERQLTVVMVSHDIESAVKYASHILHLKKQQVFFGSAAAYKQSDIGKKFIGRRLEW